MIYNFFKKIKQLFCHHQFELKKEEIPFYFECKKCGKRVSFLRRLTWNTKHHQI